MSVVSDIQKHLEEIEKCAEDLLMDQHYIVDYDKKRNVNREALRALKAPSSITQSNKTWMCIGNTFLRVQKSQIIDKIDEDQNQLETNINELRDGLRKKVDKLNDLEKKQPRKGANLVPLSKEEWHSLQQNLKL